MIEIKTGGVVSGVLFPRWHDSIKRGDMIFTDDQLAALIHEALEEFNSTERQRSIVRKPESLTLQAATAPPVLPESIRANPGSSPNPRDGNRRFRRPRGG